MADPEEEEEEAYSIIFSGRAGTSILECLKRSPGSPKAEGSDSATSQSSPSEEVGMMTEVKVKTEVPDDYIEEVIWQDDTKDSKKSMKDGSGDVPAEICVVIGGVRNQQTLGPGWAAAAALQSLSSGNSAFQLSLAALLCSEEGDFAFALG
ncbi:hypothetical protein TURU_032686 [Turdus rufiventris]|nr:hypothetical protein TURU_032686 [Turdus rufiventris]